MTIKNQKKIEGMEEILEALKKSTDYKEKAFLQEEALCLAEDSLKTTTERRVSILESDKKRYRDNLHQCHCEIGYFYKKLEDVTNHLKHSIATKKKLENIMSLINKSLKDTNSSKKYVEALLAQKEPLQEIDDISNPGLNNTIVLSYLEGKIPISLQLALAYYLEQIKIGDYQ